MGDDVKTKQKTKILEIDEEEGYDQGNIDIM